MYITEFATILVVLLTYVMANKEKIKAIYRNATRAFWYVEEKAVQKGLLTQEKSDEFVKSFKKFMKTDWHWVTEENIALALEIAMMLCAKNRPPAENKGKKEKVIKGKRQDLLTKASIIKRGMEESVLNSPEGE